MKTVGWIGETKMQNQVNSSGYFANKITSASVCKDAILLMHVTRMPFKYVIIDTPESTVWRIKVCNLISDLTNKPKIDHVYELQ